MPKVISGETRDEFVARCVPRVMNEGLTQDQAVGKCEGIYDSSVNKSAILKGKDIKKSLNISINYVRKKIKSLEMSEAKKRFTAELAGIKKAMTKEQFSKIGEMYTACRKDGLDVVKSLELAYTSVMSNKTKA